MRLGFTLVVLIVATASPAVGQEVVRAPVAEDFTPTVKVSGSVLVGLAVGPIKGPVDPRKLRISAPAGTMVDLCFTAHTRDGQYSAEARFPSTLIKTETAAIEPDTGWHHLRELSAYAFADFAAIVRLGDDCATNPKGTVAPVAYAESSLATLSVFINSQRSLSATATLEWPDGTRTSAPCTRPANLDIRSTAFDMTCALQIPQGPGEKAQLVINRRARLGAVSDIFPVMLPPQ